jgi:hypothetical protein
VSSDKREWVDGPTNPDICVEALDGAWTTIEPAIEPALEKLNKLELADLAKSRQFQKR